MKLALIQTFFGQLSNYKAEMGTYSIISTFTNQFIQNANQPRNKEMYQ